jgi:hypothetical protein
MVESSIFKGLLISSLSSKVCKSSDAVVFIEEVLIIKLRCLILISSSDDPDVPPDVIARALSRGISCTGTFTVLPLSPMRELDLLGGGAKPRGGEAAVCLCRSLPVRLLNEFVATLLQAEKTSFAASPENPRAASHSAKMDCHLLQASTVQLPILLSSLAILCIYIKYYIEELIN